MDFNSELDRIPTPVETINLANCGGLSFSTLIEVYGGSKSGKSTFCYQTAELFLAMYGDEAIVVILDAEGAVNWSRLKFTFNISKSDPRVRRLPAMTIEMANEHILRVAKEAKETGKRVLVIWDSIKVSSFNKAKDVIDASLSVEAGKKKMKKNDAGELVEVDNDMERGMTEPLARAQVMTWCLNNALHAIYDAPIVVLLINQLTTKVNRFNTSVDSSGGYALRHNVNERFRFEHVKNIGGDKKGDVFKTGTMSTFTVVKSRIMPSFQDVPVIIDDTLGGRIMTSQELPQLAHKLGVFDAKNGGWYSIKEEFLPEDASDDMRKGKQFLDWSRSGEALQILRDAVLVSMRRTFRLVDFVYNEQWRLRNPEEAAKIAAIAKENAAAAAVIATKESEKEALAAAAAAKEAAAAAKARTQSDVKRPLTGAAKKAAERKMAERAAANAMASNESPSVMGVDVTGSDPAENE